MEGYIKDSQAFDENKAEPVKPGRYSYYDSSFLLEKQPEIKIELESEKKSFNDIALRNSARFDFTLKVRDLIHVVETSAKYLTAADKREMKELLNSIISNI